MATTLTAARQLVMYAARRYDSGERADLEAGMAKLFASETAMKIALDAVRIHGGYGYSTEFDVERYFRDAPLMIVGEGTNEIQRNVIARQLVSAAPGSPVTAAARSGTVTAEPGEALAGLLGVPAPDPEDGLPLLWHWLYLLDRPEQADLGPDGHPFRGAVAEPPGPGLRRMWAGGQVTQRRTAAIGAPATRRTTRAVDTGQAAAAPGR